MEANRRKRRTFVLHHKKRLIVERGQFVILLICPTAEKRKTGSLDTRASSAYWYLPGTN
jgi:hypothetical protein